MHTSMIITEQKIRARLVKGFAFRRLDDVQLKKIKEFLRTGDTQALEQTDYKVTLSEKEVKEIYGY